MRASVAAMAILTTAVVIVLLLPSTVDAKPKAPKKSLIHGKIFRELGQIRKAGYLPEFNKPFKNFRARFKGFSSPYKIKLKLKAVGLEPRKLYMVRLREEPCEYNKPDGPGGKDYVHFDNSMVSFKLKANGGGKAKGGISRKIGVPNIFYRSIVIHDMLQYNDESIILRPFFCGNILRREP